MTWLVILEMLLKLIEIFLRNVESEPRPFKKSELKVLAKIKSHLPALEAVIKQADL